MCRESSNRDENIRLGILHVAIYLLVVPMGRDDSRLIRDAEFLKYRLSLFRYLSIALAAHQYADGSCQFLVAVSLIRSRYELRHNLILTCNAAARTVFSRSIVTVIVPTPPGTEVMYWTILIRVS